MRISPRMSLSFCQLVMHYYTYKNIGCQMNSCVLNSVSSNHSAVGICGFDKSEVLRGRLYGGCAIFW